MNPTNSKIVDSPPSYPILNWESERLVTPGELYGVIRNQKTLLLNEKASTYAKLFFESIEGIKTGLFQGLVIHEDHVFAATVTIQIKNKVVTRKPVDFKKKIFHTRLKDFEIKQVSYLGQIYYDVGHLVDDKYSAGNKGVADDNSNECVFNYVPMNYFYNRWLKDYLVNIKKLGAESVQLTHYNEFPLYTPNPPQIEDTKNRLHRVPIAIALHQINKKNNSDNSLFCFPNNGFDYEQLKADLKITSKVCTNLFFLFRIKKDFESFMRPALRFDDDTLQRQNESSALYMMTCITSNHVAFQVFKHFIERGVTSPSSFLEEKASEQIYKSKINIPLLEEVFPLFAKFLFSYSIPNAVKSEVIGTQIRRNFFDHYVRIRSSFEMFNNHRYKFSPLVSLDQFKDVIAYHNGNDIEKSLRAAGHYLQLIDYLLDYDDDDELSEYLSRCINYHKVDFDDFIETMKNTFQMTFLSLNQKKGEMSLEELIPFAKSLLELSKIELPDEVCEEADMTKIYDWEIFSEGIDNFKKFIEIFKVIHHKWGMNRNKNIEDLLLQACEVAEFYTDNVLDHEICEEIKFLKSIQL